MKNKNIIPVLSKPSNRTGLATPLPYILIMETSNPPIKYGPRSITSTKHPSNLNSDNIQKEMLFIMNAYEKHTNII